MEAEEIQNKDKNKTKYEILGVPGLIKIGDHNYVYKDQSKEDKEKFFYRCHKRECRITIEINKDNLNKLNANDNKSKIEYKQKKEHSKKISKKVKMKTNVLQKKYFYLKLKIL